MHLLYRALGPERCFLARAGCAAADIDRGNRRLVKNDCGDAGSKTRIVGMADPNARDIGEEIFHAAVPFHAIGCHADIRVTFLVGCQIAATVPPGF